MSATASRGVASHPTRQRPFAVSLADGRTVSGHRWPGRGMPLVGLHGLLDCSLGWESVARTSGRPFIAIDLPGFGDSDTPTRPRISAYAEDVIECLSLLGLDAYTLVGHSLGGAVAVAVAEQASRATKSLVLLAPAGFGRQHLAEAATLPGVQQVLGAGLPLALVNPITPAAAYRLMVANGRSPDPEMTTRIRSRAWVSTPGVMAATRAIAAAGLSKRSFARRQVEYSGPVTAVFGSADRLVPSGHAKAVAGALPQADTQVWEGMGHHPQVERPERLAALIESSIPSGWRSRRAA